MDLSDVFRQDMTVDAMHRLGIMQYYVHATYLRNASSESNRAQFESALG